MRNGLVLCYCIVLGVALWRMVLCCFIALGCMTCCAVVVVLCYRINCCMQVRCCGIASRIVVSVVCCVSATPLMFGHVVMLSVRCCCYLASCIVWCCRFVSCRVVSCRVVSNCCIKCCCVMASPHCVDSVWCAVTNWQRLRHGQIANACLSLYRNGCMAKTLTPRVSLSQRPRRWYIVSVLLINYVA